MSSEVVVQDEAKSPHDVHFILHFVAVYAHYLLRVPQLALQLLRLLHHVGTLRPKRQPRILIKLEEIGRVTEVTRCDLSDGGAYRLNFLQIVPSERRRDVVFAPVVEGQFERGQTSDVGLGADADLGQ